jgi:hypothetical protein
MVFFPTGMVWRGSVAQNRREGDVGGRDSQEHGKSFRNSEALNRRRLATIVKPGRKSRQKSIRFVLANHDSEESENARYSRCSQSGQVVSVSGLSVWCSDRSERFGITRGAEEDMAGEAGLQKALSE